MPAPQLAPRNNTARLTPAERQQLRTVVAALGWQRGAIALGVSVPTIQTLEAEYGRVSAAAVERLRQGLLRLTGAMAREMEKGE